MAKFDVEDRVKLVNVKRYKDPGTGKIITIAAGTAGKVAKVIPLRGPSVQFVEYTVDFDGFTPPARLVNEEDLTGV